ncbi:MAG: insulinase family protein [Candidatus Aminicenantes bacterium]|nr:insulinase family protein [Candidatus Aminicenantes bacterium]
MIKRSILPNGITVVTERMPQVKSVSIGVWLKEGSRDEPQAQNGIHHFLEHMMFKGTTSRSAKRIAREIDSLGGGLDAFTEKENLGFFAKVLDEHLPRVTELLADIVLNPLLRKEDIEREQGVILEEIRMFQDNPESLIHDLFINAFWENHPLGRPILGTIDTVAKFDREVLKEYFDKGFMPDNILITAAGNLRHKQVLELIARHFTLQGSANIKQRTPPGGVFTIKLHNKKELEQVHLCLGTSSFPYNHEDRYSCYLMNLMLGGSISSRLFQNIRERKGLAYSIFSYLSHYLDAGYLAIYAGTSKNNSRKVIKLILDEIKKLKSQPVKDKELKLFKDRLKGSFMLGLESTTSRMGNLARQMIYFGRCFTLDEILAGVEGVRVEDISRIAHSLFDQRQLSLVALGDVEGFKIKEEELVC